MQLVSGNMLAKQMLDRLIKLSQVLVLSATASLCAGGAFAQTPPHTRLETIPETFEKAFFDHSDSYFQNTSSWGQVQLIFGLGFPENEIAHDGKTIHFIYQDVLAQQTQSDPVIRTLDLKSPFDSSLRSNPAYLGNTVSNQSIEFMFPRAIGQ